jgi:hypothetical protein
MASFDAASIAAALRREGYEARNLGQMGITVWKNGKGVFLSAEDLTRLSGSVLQEVANLLSQA